MQNVLKKGYQRFYYNRNWQQTYYIYNSWFWETSLHEFSCLNSLNWPRSVYVDFQIVVTQKYIDAHNQCYSFSHHTTPIMEKEKLNPFTQDILD